MSRVRFLVVGLLVAGVLAGCSGRPDIDIDHRTIEAAPKPLADKGPARGVFEREWQTTVSSRSGRPAFHFVEGRLLVVTREGIQAYDARTGKPTWHYREPGRRIDGIAVTNGVVVADFSNDSNEGDDDEHTLGLDAGTGELLWENTKDWNLTHNGDGSTLGSLNLADAADGIVPVSVDYDKGRIGVDARTGSQVWKVRAHAVAGGDCAPTDGERHLPADANVLPLTFRCVKQDYRDFGTKLLLLAVEPTTGELLWSRRVDSSTNDRTDVLVEGGITMFASSTSAGPPAAPLELAGPDGRRLFASQTGRCFAGCALFVSGGRALLHYDEATGRVERGTEKTREMLLSIDLKTGRITRMPAPPRSGPYVAAGGKLHTAPPVYAGDTKFALVPSGLNVIDVARRRVDVAPLPYPSPWAVPLAYKPGTSETLVAVGGRRLFTVLPEQPPTEPDAPYRAQLEAYAAKPTSGSPELAGVLPDDWPDPCALLADIPHHYDESEPPDPGSPVNLGEVTLERVSCYRDGTEVRIGWVAGTEREAEALFPVREPSDVGADAELQLQTNTTAYRVGRTILYVMTYYDEPDQVARQVIANLKAL